MARLEGRAAWPSLFIFAAGLLLLVASLFAGEGYRWGAIALLVAACAPWRVPCLDGVGILLTLLSGWMLINAIFVTPAYAAESLYRPAILAASFAAFVALPHAAAARLFRGGVAVMGLLVLLGLAQYFFGFWHLEQNPLRAAATFITPNTFATALNLFLVPVAVLYLAVDRSPRMLALALWLFAGLVASQSRGGMLALLVGLAFAAACLGATRLRGAAKAAATLLLAGAVAWLAIIEVGDAVIPVVQGNSVSTPSLDAWVGRETWDRREIYLTTLKLVLERPLMGAGANMFWPLFEPRRPAIFGDKTFLFAHNDYLQFWLEYGLAGMLLLIGLAAAALLRARQATRTNPADLVPLACGAALASLFAHAVVDFPFYVPFLLFLAGANLGVLASTGRAQGESPFVAPWLSVTARAALAFAAMALLAQPMLAELASAHSLAVLGRGDIQRGLYWQSVARRLEPRNPSRYWAESVIWRELAKDTGDRKQWAKADALLAEGIRANPPYAFSIMLDRARMHRLHPGMFDPARSPKELLAWVEGAVALAPTAVAGRVELARALAFAGKPEDARRVESALVARHPDNPLVRSLIKDLK